VASVPAGSGNYVQNTLTRQSAANFNIGGNGTLGGTLAANLVNATTQYNINGARVLSTNGVRNTFAGVGAGAGPFNTGFDNAFFGFNAGSSNTIGGANAFFGSGAGLFNTSGASNSFFGNTAGESNTTGASNSFFGASAGFHNTTAGSNSFFGGNAGFANTTGAQNSFFGFNAGFSNTSGGNSFFGFNAGRNNIGGFSNAFFGTEAGESNTTGNNNAYFGNFAGLRNVTGFGNAYFGSYAGSFNPTGSNNTLIGSNVQATVDNLDHATAIGADATVNTSNTVVLGRNADAVQVPGKLFFGTLGFSGNTPLCRNPSNQISFCSSSFRYKNAVRPFLGGLEIINRLRPISFTWKDHPERDLGLGAEDVAQVEPLLILRNDKGEVEGVKYDHLNVVLINAIQQQEAQLKQQQTQIESLKKLVCQDHPHASVCKTKR